MIRALLFIWLVSVVVVALLFRRADRRARARQRLAWSRVRASWLFGDDAPPSRRAGAA